MSSSQCRTGCSPFGVVSHVVSCSKLGLVSGYRFVNAVRYFMSDGSPTRQSNTQLVSGATSGCTFGSTDCQAPAIAGPLNGRPNSTSVSFLRVVNVPNAALRPQPLRSGSGHA